MASICVSRVGGATRAAAQRRLEDIWTKGKQLLICSAAQRGRAPSKPLKSLRGDLVKPKTPKIGENSANSAIIEITGIKKGGTNRPLII